MTDTTKQPQPDTSATLQPLSAEERETWTAVARQRGRWHDHLAANLLAEPFLRLLAERDALAEREELQKRARGDPECPLCGATNCAHRERWDFAVLREVAINRRHQIAELTAAKEQAEARWEVARDEAICVAEDIVNLTGRAEQAERERDDAEAIRRELTSTTVAMIQEREGRIAELTQVRQRELTYVVTTDDDRRAVKAWASSRLRADLQAEALAAAHDEHDAERAKFDATETKP